MTPTERARELFRIVPEADGYTTVWLAGEVAEVALHVDALREVNRLAAPIARAIEEAVAEAHSQWDHDRRELEYELSNADEDIARARAEAYEDAASLVDRTPTSELVQVAARIRARAALPAPGAEPATPAPAAEPATAEREAERAVVEAAVRWRAALDALAAARRAR